MLDEENKKKEKKTRFFHIPYFQFYFSVNLKIFVLEMQLSHME